MAALLRVTGGEHRALDNLCHSARAVAAGMGFPRCWLSHPSSAGCRTGHCRREPADRAAYRLAPLGCNFAGDIPRVLPGELLCLFAAASGQQFLFLYRMEKQASRVEG